MSTTTDKSFTLSFTAATMAAEFMAEAKAALTLAEHCRQLATLAAIGSAQAQAAGEFLADVIGRLTAIIIETPPERLAGKASKTAKEKAAFERACAKYARDKVRIYMGRALVKVDRAIEIKLEKGRLDDGRKWEEVSVSIGRKAAEKGGNNGGGRKPVAKASATVKAEAEKIAAAIVAKREKELAAMADNDKKAVKKSAAEKLTIVSGLLPSLSDTALRQIIDQAQAIMAKRQASADALKVKRPRRERALTIAETLPLVTGKPNGKAADKAAH